MSSPERVSVPILAQLIPGGIRPGTLFVVEFDPESQWYAVAATIAANFLKTNGRVGYAAFTRPPEEVKRVLSSLGVDLASVAREGRLTVDDWYSASLTGGRLESTGSGQTGFFEGIEGGGVRALSLKVTDLSIEWHSWKKSGPKPYDVSETWPPGALGIGESVSEILRFNDENAFLEWVINRTNPNDRRAQRIALYGYVRGIHSELLYKRIEAAFDGVIDIRVMEEARTAKNFLRVRSLKGQPHDSSWHEIEIKPNGEAVLVS